MLTSEATFSESIRQVEAALANAKTRLEEADTYAKGKQNEVDTIADAVREAAGRAGAGAFTREFEREAARLALVSRWWLGAVGLLAALTVGAAVGSFF